jgi:hypothetical protein
VQDELGHLEQMPIDKIKNLLLLGSGDDRKIQCRMLQGGGAFSASRDFLNKESKLEKDLGDKPANSYRPLPN